MSKKRDKNKSQECQCSNCQKKSTKLNNSMGNNPFGINPSQLMGLLGNIDMGQIGSILSSMNKDGFDLNNINLGAIQNNRTDNQGQPNNIDLAAIEKMMSGMGIKDNSGLSSIQDMINNIGSFQGAQNSINKDNYATNINTNSSKNNVKNKKNRSDDIKRDNNKNKDENIKIDENIEMLLSIKKIVNYDKGKFIDKIIEFYNAGEFDEDDD